VARLAGRVLRLPAWSAIVGCALVGVGAVLVAATRQSGWLVVGLAVVGALLVGAGCRPPLQHPLGWQLSSLLWLAEAGLVLALVNALPERAEWVGYAYLAAVAWHRYDVVYRLRDTGTHSQPWVTLVTLGVDGRWVLLALVAALGGPVGALLGWAALVLFVLYAVESAIGWRRWASAEHDDAEATDDLEVAP